MPEGWGYEIRMEYNILDQKTVENEITRGADVEHLYVGRFYHQWHHDSEIY
jgi:hypothetical protein